MHLRRWLLVGALVCALIGAGTLTLSLCCIFDLIGGQCELWLLGPLLALPLGLGFALIGRAAGKQPVGESPQLDESTGSGEREEA
ncbi:MAG: hypothetical protein OXS30_03975 [Chloroflexota bacterium]|nr:hypothetical protein [Chloroflexota bacterium]